MRKLVLILFLAGCAPNPLVNHCQCDWRCILEDPVMNQLMDETPLASSMVASVYVQFRGLQQRQQLLQTHIENHDELILLTSDLVERGVANTVDLQTLISSRGTMKAESLKVQTNLDKLLYQLAPLVKLDPCCLAERLCNESSLPVPLRDIPDGSCTDLLSYYNNVERVKVLTQAKDAAKKSYDMSEDLFKRGLKSSIDLLMTNKTLMTAEDDLIQAKVDLLSDYITLYNRY